MKLTYTVHSAALGHAEVNADLNGKTVRAQVPALTVELVHPDQPTVTLRISDPGDLVKAQALFGPGAEVSVKIG